MKSYFKQFFRAIKKSFYFDKLLIAIKSEKQANSESQFIIGMSHELRTPLNAVIGFSDILLSEDFGNLNEKQKKFLQNISVSGEHLLKLVNDILDISKIESGNMSMNYELFNAEQAILETVSVIDSLAMKKKIEIKMNVGRNIFINADLKIFKQIMYNLLSNSIKYTDIGGKVLIKAYYQERDLLKVEVQDSGIGISSSYRNKLFKNFKRINTSSAQQQEGSGLGLFITKKLVELHKGKIDFVSEENKGSVFWFTLPGLAARESIMENFQPAVFGSC